MDLWNMFRGKSRETSEDPEGESSEESKLLDRPRSSGEERKRFVIMDNMRHSLQGLLRSRHTEEPTIHGLSSFINCFPEQITDLDADQISEERSDSILKFINIDELGNSSAEANNFENKTDVIDRLVKSMADSAVFNTSVANSSEETDKNKDIYDQKSKGDAESKADPNKSCASSISTLKIPDNTELQDQNYNRVRESPSSANKYDLSTVNASKGAIKKSPDKFVRLPQQSIEQERRRPIDLPTLDYSTRNHKKSIREILHNLREIYENSHLFDNDIFSEMLHTDLRRINDMVQQYITIVDMYKSCSTSNTDNKENVSGPSTSPMKLASRNDPRLLHRNLDKFEPSDDSSNILKLAGTDQEKASRDNLRDSTWSHYIASDLFATGKNLSSQDKLSEVPYSLVPSAEKKSLPLEKQPNLPEPENNNRPTAVAEKFVPAEVLDSSLVDEEKNSQESYISLDPFGCDRSNYDDTLLARRLRKEKPEASSTQISQDYNRGFLQNFTKQTKKIQEAIAESQRRRSQGQPKKWVLYKEANTPDEAVHEETIKIVKASEEQLVKDMRSIEEELPGYDVIPSKEEPAVEYISEDGNVLKFLHYEGGIYRDKMINIRKKKEVNTKKHVTYTVPDIHKEDSEEITPLPTSRRVNFPLEPPEEAGACAPSQMLTCPVCFKKFLATEIEKHAWDCQNYGDDGAYGGF